VQNKENLTLIQKEEKKTKLSKGAQDVADKTPFGGAIKGKPSLLNTIQNSSAGISDDTSRVVDQLAGYKRH
jgi:hypothetical protein